MQHPLLPPAPPQACPKPPLPRTPSRHRRASDSQLHSRPPPLLRRRQLLRVPSLVRRRFLPTVSWPLFLPQRPSPTRQSRYASVAPTPQGPLLSLTNGHSRRCAPHTSLLSLPNSLGRNISTAMTTRPRTSVYPHRHGAFHLSNPTHRSTPCPSSHLPLPPTAYTPRPSPSQVLFRTHSANLQPRSASV